MEDYYGILGIEHGADAAAIQKAYELRVVNWYNDNNGNSTSGVNEPEAEAARQKKLELIREAFKVLSDPTTRAPYDLHLEGLGNTQPSSIPGPSGGSQNASSSGGIAGSSMKKSTQRGNCFEIAEMQTESLFGSSFVRTETGPNFSPIPAIPVISEIPTIPSFGLFQPPFSGVVGRQYPTFGSNRRSPTHVAPFSRRGARSFASSGSQFPQRPPSRLGRIRPSPRRHRIRRLPSFANRSYQRGADLRQRGADLRQLGADLRQRGADLRQRVFQPPAATAKPSRLGRMLGSAVSYFRRHIRIEYSYSSTEVVNGRNKETRVRVVNGVRITEVFMDGVLISSQTSKA